MVTAVLMDIRIIMMVNATSVPKGITSMTQVQDIAVLRDIPIILMANAGSSLEIQVQPANKPPIMQAAASARDITTFTRTVEARTRRAMPITRPVFSRDVEKSSITAGETRNFCTMIGYRVEINCQ